MAEYSSTKGIVALRGIVERQAWHVFGHITDVWDGWTRARDHATKVIQTLQRAEVSAEVKNGSTVRVPYYYYANSAINKVQSSQRAFNASCYQLKLTT